MTCGEVHAGELIPADGIVESGQSRLALALLTGESVPEPVAAGSPVWAGARNEDGTLRIRVSRSGLDTRIGQICAQVEQAQAARPPSVELADKLAGGFVVAVVMLGALAFFLGWRQGGSGPALSRAVALMIVACPCALALATPLTWAVAMAAAARRGILIKRADVLEKLARPGMMVLDKTGTLTEGKPVLVAWQPTTAGQAPMPRASQALLLALERQSPHPLGKALVRALEPEFGMTAPRAENVRSRPGQGVSGEVDGQIVLAGNQALLEAHGVTLSPAANARQACSAPERTTPVYLAAGNTHIATAWLGDAPRADATEALAKLQQDGWQLQVRSGDRPEVVQHVAETLGLSVEHAHGGQSPEDKQACIETWRKAHPDTPIVMLGDGVNDAAALAAADVGLAIHGGAEASLAAADACLDRPDLSGICELLALSVRARRVLIAAIALSLTYNIVAVTLALQGLIGPLAAALLMPLSSLSVLGVALLAGRTATAHNGSLDSTP